MTGAPRGRCISGRAIRGCCRRRRRTPRRRRATARAMRLSANARLGYGCHDTTNAVPSKTTFGWTASDVTLIGAASSVRPIPENQILASRPKGPRPGGDCLRLDARAGLVEHGAVHAGARGVDRAAADVVPGEERAVAVACNGCNGAAARRHAVNRCRHRPLVRNGRLHGAGEGEERRRKAQSAFHHATGTEAGRRRSSFQFPLLKLKMKFVKCTKGAAMDEAIWR